jgi:hypothetical protein
MKQITKSWITAEVGNMPHRLGSGEYISQGIWRNSLVFLDYGISNPYIPLPDV